ncbi:uncharacterized protein LOC119983736 isoform X1 [Tripterygium wilfordii]|uniref:uncharacterized protein LOC119983736 isoform X1 n=1 Tax=Tripterygium wilfordii TaxID=458696 RepID=UPI0018F848B3|nr:uncharacterized protein LOC119983736 isoform X1 [Tripterygium wilfordii]XP_038683383.1 uncharacterized protein LOC119983736 isoform X1 [Tripterygium wilfordii]XP_038683384.1 uncharacterized protein LOC119983736 isoform X1 [Tripterygium wilfordii]XP_038683385.1 uncharacterized protein LOC119983736 isoform X1 [Tripterygium wilfordii]
MHFSIGIFVVVPGCIYGGNTIGNTQKSCTGREVVIMHFSIAIFVAVPGCIYGGNTIGNKEGDEDTLGLVIWLIFMHGTRTIDIWVQLDLLANRILEAFGNANLLKKPSSVGEGIEGPTKMSRYPVRIVLWPYMILGHPDSVFYDQGERKIALSKPAKEFVREFELLLEMILEGPKQGSDENLTPPHHRNVRPSGFSLQLLTEHGRT